MRNFEKITKSKLVKRVKMGVIAAIVATLSVTISYADLQDEKDKKDEMEAQLKDTESLLDSLENYKSDSEAYIKLIDERLSGLASNIYNLQQQTAAKQKEIDLKKKEIKLKQKEIESQYNDMSIRIQYMYENGSQEYASLLLGSENMSEFLNRAEYIMQITQYDRDMLEKLKNAKAELKEEENVLEAALKELNALLTETEQEQAAQQSLLQAKQNDLAYTNTQILDANNQIQAMEEDIAAQEELIKELEEIERRRQLANIQLTYDGGQLEWPLPGYSAISSSFGYRIHPITGVAHLHSGIDIPAPTGTVIYAAYDGQVAWSNYNWSAGNWVGVDHGNGLFSIYMHMSTSLVSEGQYVKKGDPIGLVGSTGSSTGPHLHFSVRLNGQYVEPLSYVIIP